MRNKAEISNIKNLAVVHTELDGMDIYNLDSSGFELSGLYWRKPGGAFCRLPETMDLEFSAGVKSLMRCTTGAALHFKTDSRQVKLHASLAGSRMSHMTLVGSMGFDLYVGTGFTQVFSKSTVFPYEQNEYTCLLFNSPNRKLRDFTIYFPLYSGVNSVEIGLEHDATVQNPPVWPDPRPIVLYGTSITQGGCVSRSGMLYSNILSRLISRPIYNFGFSGNGKGEPQIAEKLAEIQSPAMFILDYDDNALPERLGKTLEPFIGILRKKHPQTPILTLSTEPKSAEAYEPFDSDYASKQRPLYTEIHHAVNQKFRAAGDDNIYFLDGRQLYGADFEECTVDGAHATDLGNYRIAHALEPFVSRILNRWW